MGILRRNTIKDGPECRRSRAWHIVGHAWVARLFNFPVAKLSLNGFKDEDLETIPGSSCLPLPLKFVKAWSSSGQMATEELWV